MTTRILEILRCEGEISDSTRKLVSNYLNEWNCSGYVSLLETNVFSEPALANILAKALKIDRIYSIPSANVNKEILDFLPYAEAADRECFPLNYVGQDNQKIEVLFSDPTDTQNIQAVEKLMGMKVKIAVAERAEILNAINQYYPLETQISNLGAIT